MTRWIVLIALALAACGSPDQVGQRVGRSLYDASVNTGHALAVVGDRTGAAIQDAGANLRNAANPAPLPPIGLPPPYIPDGSAPVTAEPLPPPSYEGPRDVPANPALGY